MVFFFTPLLQILGEMAVARHFSVAFLSHSVAYICTSCPLLAWLCWGSSLPLWCLLARLYLREVIFVPYRVVTPSLWFAELSTVLMFFYHLCYNCLDYVKPIPCLTHGLLWSSFSPGIFLLALPCLIRVLSDNGVFLLYSHGLAGHHSQWLSSVSQRWILCLAVAVACYCVLHPP